MRVNKRLAGSAILARITASTAQRRRSVVYACASAQEKGWSALHPAEQLRLRIRLLCDLAAHYAEQHQAGADQQRRGGQGCGSGRRRVGIGIGEDQVAAEGKIPRGAEGTGEFATQCREARQYRSAGRKRAQGLENGEVTRIKRAIHGQAGETEWNIATGITSRYHTKSGIDIADGTENNRHRRGRGRAVKRTGAAGVFVHRGVQPELRISSAAFRCGISYHYST